MVLRHANLPRREEGHEFAAGGSLGHPPETISPRLARRLWLICELGALLHRRAAFDALGDPRPPHSAGAGAPTPPAGLHSVFAMGRHLPRPPRTGARLCLASPHLDRRQVRYRWRCHHDRDGRTFPRPLPRDADVYANAVADDPGALPLLSVIPQELVFRTFFFHRYGPLFGDWKWIGVAVNGLLFGFAHIIFDNWIAVAGSAVIGAIIAYRYWVTRSFWAGLARAHALWLPDLHGWPRALLLYRCFELLIIARLRWKRLFSRAVLPSTALRPGGATIITL